MILFVWNAHVKISNFNDASLDPVFKYTDG